MPYTKKGAMPPELKLLFMCARVSNDYEDYAHIRQILLDGIDWTLFVRKSLDHGLAGLVGHALGRAAPELVPDDIREAFQTNLERTRNRNRDVFDELVRVISSLDKNDIHAIAFKGPTLAIQAYGDLAFREFRDLDFLVGDEDIDKAMSVLKKIGYERKGQLTDAQVNLIQHIQGQEIIFNNEIGVAIEPHTRLIPIKMALQIDYPGLRRRAKIATLNGCPMQVLSPEDVLLVLAIHGGKEFWWRINWACDVAAFVGAHPELDWSVIIQRAREQGSLRMVLLAASLAREYFSTKIPDQIICMVKADQTVEKMVRTITASWITSDPLGPPSNKTVSLDRLYLHDRALQRLCYIVRTWFLPGPEIVAWIALPRALSFAYTPLKVAHDSIMLPLWRIYRAFVRPRYNQD
jgi:hypothetical protein